MIARHVERKTREHRQRLGDNVDFAVAPRHDNYGKKPGICSHHSAHDCKRDVGDDGSELPAVENRHNQFSCNQENGDDWQQAQHHDVDLLRGKYASAQTAVANARDARVVLHSDCGENQSEIASHKRITRLIESYNLRAGNAVEISREDVVEQHGDKLAERHQQTEFYECRAFAQSLLVGNRHFRRALVAVD